MENVMLKPINDQQEAIRDVLETILGYFYDIERPEIAAEIGSLIAHVKFGMEPEWIAQLTKSDPL